MALLMRLLNPENGNMVPANKKLEPEPPEGNVEYKLKLVDMKGNRFDHLVTQMKWRLREGNGEALYEIGVKDQGSIVGLVAEELEVTLDTLQRMADKLGATLIIQRQQVMMSPEDPNQEPKFVAEVLVRKVPDDQNHIELRVAVLGNVDVGKSTLLGVLTQGQLDNGKGKARLNLFRYHHEIKSGHTSSISREILGFNAEGKVVNYNEVETAEEICALSSKLVNFIDLAGHQKYLKTTVFGLMGHSPHFAMLVVSGSAGIAGTTREHLSLATALAVPFFVVITKIDLCQPKVLSNTLKQLKKVLTFPGCRKVPLKVSSENDVMLAASRLVSDNVTPIFLVSNFTGSGLDLLVKFLNALPPSYSVQEQMRFIQEPIEFQIDETFRVPDVPGNVLGGMLTRGTLRLGDEVVLGPTDNGQYVRVYVHSIHSHRAPCSVVRAGQSASVALQELDLVSIHKGMVLLNASQHHTACKYFTAKIVILYHSTSIQVGFQATVHIGNIRQTATVRAIMGKRSIQTNDKATVMFEFLRHPEYLRRGASLLFRERTTKGIGEIIDIFPMDINANHTN